MTLLCGDLYSLVWGARNFVRGAYLEVDML